MKLFVVFGFLCLGAVLAVPTGETAVEKVETEELADTKTTLFLTEESDGLTNERQERSYGYKPEHKGHSGHGGHGYGHEHKGHGYGHESHHGGHGYGHEQKGHGYGHSSHHGGHGYGHEHKGHGYGHDHKGHSGHGYGHEQKGHGGHGYGHEQKGHGYGHGHGYEHKGHGGHGYGHGHGHGYKSNFEAAEQFDAQADFVASPQYGHAAPAYGHHGGHAGHYVQPVHHQTHSYGAHAPKVECGSNLLVGCNVHTAKVPCVPHHGHGYGHAAPAYHAPAHYAAPAKYEHKPAAHHGYKFGADEEPKEQPKEDKQ